MNDHDLRDRFKTMAERPSPPADCPEAGSIWEAALGRASIAGTERTLDHVAVCPTCAIAWRLAGDFGAEEVAPVSVERRIPARRWWLPAAAAATVVLTAALVLLRLSGPGTIEPNMRSARSLEFRPLAADGSSLPRERFVLGWEVDVPPGTRYELRLLDEDLALLYRAGALDRNRLHVPATALASLKAGTRLHWQVEASLPDGRHVTSPTFSVRVE